MNRSAVDSWKRWQSRPTAVFILNSLFNILNTNQTVVEIMFISEPWMSPIGNNAHYVID